MKKLLVISGKGGTGKTTVSSSIIHELHVPSFADCDVDAPNLHILHRFSEDPVRSDFIGGSKAIVTEESCIGCGICKDLCRFDAIKIENGKSKVIDISCEGCGVCEYACPVNAISMKPDVAGNLDLYKSSNDFEEITFSTAELKMGRGNSGKLVSKVKENLFDSISDDSFVVLDGSPGVGCPVMASLTGVDLALVVTEPTLSGMSDLERILKSISLSCTKAAVCVNKFDVNIEMTDKIKSFCAKAGVPFVGEIPYDKNASKAINQGKSVIETDGPASTALKKLTQNISSLMEEI